MKITGKTLIELGYQSGKWFKEALIEANKQELEGEDLKKYLESVKCFKIDEAVKTASLLLVFITPS